MTTPADLQAQIEAVLRATHDAVNHGIAGDAELLCAAAATLRDLMSGKWVRVPDDAKMETDEPLRALQAEPGEGGE